MLDWLKEIIGESYTDAMEKAVEVKIGQHFVARADFNAVNGEKKGLEGQISEANKTIESMKSLDIEGMKKAAETWEAKYKEDTEALRSELERTKYTHNIESLAIKERFSSEAARKAFIADLAAKNLPYENDKLVGYDDFKKSYMESDPRAFTKEQEGTPAKLNTGGKHTEFGSTEADAFTASAMIGAGLNIGKE